MSLKPCPFCGSDAALVSDPEHLCSGNILQMWRIECLGDECGVRTPKTCAKRTAVEMWDRRV